MRPPEFTGGNGNGGPVGERRQPASMRPPEFTGGNPDGRIEPPATARAASMRPPEFTGGNWHTGPDAGSWAARFNEAAGIHRRKRQRGVVPDRVGGPASMRPPEFTGGNHTVHAARFRGTQASMRPPEFTGGNR